MSQFKSDDSIIVNFIDDSDFVIRNRTSPQGWNMQVIEIKLEYGAPERIRTSDPCLRRAVLYPAELRARGA